MEAIIVLPGNEKKLKALMKRLDNREEYGDSKQFWLQQNSVPEEITMSYEGLSINYGTDNGMSVFIRVPTEELIEHFARFDFFKSFEEQCKKILSQKNSAKKAKRNIKKMVKWA